MKQYLDLREMKRDVTKTISVVSSLLSELDRFDKKIAKIDWQNKFVGHFNKSFRSSNLLRYFQLLDSLQQQTLDLYSMLQQLNDWSSKVKENEFRYNKLKNQIRQLLTAIEDKITLSLGQCCSAKQNVLTKFLSTISNTVEYLCTSLEIEKVKRLCNAYYLSNVDIEGITYPIVTLLIYVIDGKTYISFNKARVFPFIDYSNLYNVNKTKILSEVKKLLKNENVISPLTETGYTLSGSILYLKNPVIPSKFNDYISKVKKFKANKVGLKLKEDVLLSDDSVKLLSSTRQVPEDVILEWAKEI